MITNPFKPTAGAEPPHLIGRDDIILAFTEGLAEGVGAPGRLMRISGPRGSGKTVLLNDLGEKASEAGWDVIHLAAGPDLMSDLFYELSPQAKVTTVSAGAFGVSGSVSLAAKEPNLKALMKRRAEETQGLLVTIDEVQDADHDEMVRIAQATQWLIGEKDDVALIFAGLPMGVADLIQGKAMTFLRRALDERLTDIGESEVHLSFGDSFEQTGLDAPDDVLDAMTKATKGYAYLIQLVGYYVWKRADRHRADSTVVTLQDVQEGTEIALERFHQTVHEPAIARLSKGAVEYLLAMADDKVVSSTQEVARRLGKSTRETSSYRRTLLQHEVIESPKRGYVQFAIPFMREYLLDNREEILERF